MPLSLPADPPAARKLTDVVPNVLAALDGGSGWFPPARSAVVLVADGLGRANLSARAGHARWMTSRLTKKSSARTVFPSTTAAALTSLLTGVDAGTHGLVGYRVRIPGTDAAPNQLRGWETDGLDPHTWQRVQPIMARESAAGRPCFAITKPKFAGTGFTEATLRGTEFVGVDDLLERMSVSAELAARHPGALIYTYIPDLDAIGHARGWESDEWAAGLERVDAAVAALERDLPATAGAVLTADHGMVDVPAHRQVLLRSGDDLVDGVRVIAGEPRMLHLFAEPGAEGEVLTRWRESEESRSWVLSRSEAVEAGLFGATVDDEVLPRIGDVLVAARSAVAYYDDRLADKKAQGMIGQHGSLTDAERVVPLLPLGAFAA
jgi:predicted AlkP superfamily pyrophosphatase or phosphodiesterase